MSVLEDAAADVWLVCVLGGPGSGRLLHGRAESIARFTPPVSLNYRSFMLAQPMNPDAVGGEVAVGRVAPNVARVTYTRGNKTVDAAVGNGVYVVRIAHSDEPDEYVTPIVRAYDKNETLLGQIAS